MTNLKKPLVNNFERRKFPTMLQNKKWTLFALFVLFGAVVLAACQPQTETVTVEVTRVVTETAEVEGETVVVTEVVVETVV